MEGGEVGVSRGGDSPPSGFIPHLPYPPSPCSSLAHMEHEAACRSLAMLSASLPRLRRLDLRCAVYVILLCGGEASSPYETLSPHACDLTVPNCASYIAPLPCR